MPLVNQTYVYNLLREMQDRNRTYHKKIDEIEQIRHLENTLALPSEERPSGLTVRVGAASQLIEDVKAAMTTNAPTVHHHPLRSGDPAKANSSKRETFWGAYLGSVLRVVNELADGQVGLGTTVLKGVYYPWPKNPRRRLPSEKGDDKAFRDRTTALKRLWGPPFRLTTVHPLAFYPRLGAGDELIEWVEHSYKPRRDIYAAYGIRKMADWEGGPKFQDLPDTQAGAVSGQPTEEIRGLPAGTDTSTMCLVTEYWCPEAYVVYVDGRQVHEEADPSVHCELCIGRTSASKDPDKLGTSVAEIMRHNEPTLDRTLTRIAEATELVVRKRLTMEVPEGAIIPEVVSEAVEGMDNRPQTKTWTFKADTVEPLPAGARIVDPFEGVENAFQALPFVELMFRIIGSHGVSPIFRGIPPGAAGSGYRDNSLYMMAKSQFQYLQDSFQLCLSNMVCWLEDQLQRRVSQEIWMGNLSLKPSDIRDFPAEISVTVEPLLPQNLMSEAQLWDRMHARGHVTRRAVLEKGLRQEQPEQMMWDRNLEDIQEMLLPLLYQDVLQTVGILPPTQPQLVGPDGKTPVRTLTGKGGIAELLGRDGGRGEGEAAQSAGGRAREGQERQPPEAAGSFPPGMEEEARWA